MKRLFYKAIIFLFLAILAHSSYAEEETKPSALLDENILIVEIAVGQSSTNENVEIYQHEGGFLVPLGFLTQFIDFPIEVNMDNKQAYGWFIKENRTFLLDMIKKTVTIEGKETPLGSRIAQVGASDIYVDSSLFSEWFPVDLELDFSRLLLKIKPREKLPFQEKEEREKQRSMLQKTEKKQNDYPKIITPAENFNIPFFDFDFGNQFDTKASPRNDSSFSILAQGDAAKFSTNLFLSGDSKDDLTSARIKAGNKDRDGNLLGGLHATEYSFGDIDSVALPLVSTRGHGYGAYISNFDLSRPDQFDQTSFVGDSQPGWEVEIYRNGELLSFQTVGTDGRYEFDNIPVLYGNNSFRIVSYGPQGQVNEETKNYSIDDSILTKGKFNYRFSADEKSQSIFGVDETLTPPQTNKEGRFVGGIEYGITDKITALTGVVHTPLEDLKTHDYQTLGLQSSIGGVLSSLNTAYDYQNNGVAGQAVMNTSVKDVSLRFERRQFNNFVSEEDLATSPLRTSTSKFDVNGRLSKIIPSGISYGFGVQDESFVNNYEIVTYSNRLSTTAYGIGFGNNFQWVDTKNSDITSSVGSGDFSIRGNYKQVFLRISTNYHLYPNSDIQSVDFSAQKDLPNNMNIRSELKKDLGEQGLTTLNLSLNKEFKYYRLSTLASADDTSNYTIGVRFSFSLGNKTTASPNNEWFVKSRSMAADGAISATAFLDNNYDGIYDDGDKMLDNVGFQSGNKKYPPNDDGKSTLVTNVEPYVPSDLEVNTATIEDPYMVPKVKGYSVTTRPGKATPVNFPIIYTTEIDGDVYLNKAGNVRPLGRAIVELIDSNGKVVNSTKSEYDGFYVFSGVIPGEYTISLAKETLDKLKITEPTAIPLNIPHNSDAISGINITATSENIDENINTEKNEPENIDNNIIENKEEENPLH